jgi:hypothetical protein
MFVRRLNDLKDYVEARVKVCSPPAGSLNVLCAAMKVCTNRGIKMGSCQVAIRNRIAGNERPRRPRHRLPF